MLSQTTEVAGFTSFSFIFQITSQCFTNWSIFLSQTNFFCSALQPVFSAFGFPLFSFTSKFIASFGCYPLLTCPYHLTFATFIILSIGTVTSSICFNSFVLFLFISFTPQVHVSYKYKN